MRKSCLCHLANFSLSARFQLPRIAYTRADRAMRKCFQQANDHAAVFRYYEAKLLRRMPVLQQRDGREFGILRVCVDQKPSLGRDVVLRARIKPGSCRKLRLKEDGGR